MPYLCNGTESSEQEETHRQKVQMPCMYETRL